MKRTIQVGIALIFLAAAFEFGAYTGKSRGGSSEPVSVEVVNKSGQLIQSISLAYGTCGNKGTIAADALAQTQSMRFQFLVCGEGGYSLEVLLSDGRVIKSIGGYVESGFSITEIVSKDGITH